MAHRKPNSKRTTQGNSVIPPGADYREERLCVCGSMTDLSVMVCIGCVLPKCSHVGAQSQWMVLLWKALEMLEGGLQMEVMCSRSLVVAP